MYAVDVVWCDNPQELINKPLTNKLEIHVAAAAAAADIKTPAVVAIVLAGAVASLILTAWIKV